jgi:isoquinoline 1-oxidoreductase
VKSGARGRALTAWEFHNYNSGPRDGTPYDVANQKVQFHPVKSPLRQGSTALASTANHFARETHMNELAHELKMDPLAFRLKNLSDPRLRAVFEAVAEKFGWAKRAASPGVGYGIAGGTEKGGYIATCAEIAVDPTSRRVQVRRVAAAFECGAVVNPDGLRNQVEGAIVRDSAARSSSNPLRERKILNPHFAQYRLPASRTSPDETVLLDRRDCRRPEGRRRSSASRRPSPPGSSRRPARGCALCRSPRKPRRKASRA